jgi:hypothetical protein
MRIHFQDLEEEDNPLNGKVFTDPDRLLGTLVELHQSRPPFMCELSGDNGFILTVGLGRELGCVQHAAKNGMPPYLMAIDPAHSGGSSNDLDFLVGGTATPIPGRFGINFEKVKEIVREFAGTGCRSSVVKWEEI